MAGIETILGFEIKSYDSADLKRFVADQAARYALKWVRKGEIVYQEDTGKRWEYIGTNALGGHALPTPGTDWVEYKGITTFLGLSDTPSSFTANAMHAANAAGNALIATGLFWNASTNRFGNGTASPSAKFHNVGNGTTGGTFNFRTENQDGSKSVFFSDSGQLIIEGLGNQQSVIIRNTTPGQTPGLFFQGSSGSVGMYISGGRLFINGGVDFQAFDTMTRSLRIEKATTRNNGRFCYNIYELVSIDGLTRWGRITLGKDKGNVNGVYSMFDAYVAHADVQHLYKGHNNAEELVYAIAASGRLYSKPLTTYADNAAALAGGMTAGMHYYTATGEYRIVV